MQPSLPRDKPTVMIAQPEGLTDATTNELLAMVEVMYLAATADGFFSADERREFLSSVESLSEGKISGEHLSELVDAWAKRGPETDLSHCLEQLARSLPDTLSRRIAYGLAMQIAESDGQLLESEASLLRKVAAAFDLESGEPEEIAESVRMSRRPLPPA